MDKGKIAQVLNLCGTLLELKGENRFRCLAYQNAARALEQLDFELNPSTTPKELATVRGIGSTMAEKITELLKTGRLEFLEQLQQEIPAGLIEMLRIPGFGPKKIKQVFDQLKIETIPELQKACSDGSIAQLKGFGKKTAEKILSGIDFLSLSGQRHRIDTALALAAEIFQYTCNHPDVLRSELCGSLRRRKETIRDIDILVSSKNPERVMDRFLEHPARIETLGHGSTKSSAVFEPGIQVDLRVVEDSQFPFALHYFTGSKEHNIRMRALAQEHDLKLNEYELSGPKKSIACQSEADIFEALGLCYIPPELREDSGEIEAARQGTLPDLIEPGDIRGCFHCHSTWSDGAATVEEMARAARKLGFEYLGFADHSRTAAYAGGLSIQKVVEQQREIDKVSQNLEGISLLKGIESDILPDGSLDYPDEVLKSFDYVVASIHSSFTMSREEMTRRVIKAVEHPACTMLGHPTGRLLLRRDGFDIDLDAVLQACAQNRTMIEINAQPSRLDLDWKHCKIAKSKGVRIVINPDAHATSGLELIPFGVHVARRGWLESADVVNTQSAKQVLHEIRSKPRARDSAKPRRA